jgi:lipid-A-disaccharide synthase-like uncharacterized protein
LNTYWLYALGFLGQAMFGARLIIQWWLSEKRGHVVSPLIYWYLSLAGSFIFLVYGIVRKDPVILGGQLISYYIYIRNLQLKGAWARIIAVVRVVLLLSPFAIIGLFAIEGGPEQTLATIDFAQLTHPLMLVGAVGQLALNLRFVYQWYYSEKNKTSALPFGFWFISTWASVLVIVYALFHPIYSIEPVLLISQCMGIVPYARNMYLSKRGRS